MDLLGLPLKLVTVRFEDADNKSNFHESEPPPGSFCLTVPHAMRRNTHLWEEIGNTDDLDNSALKKRIGPICEEVAYYQKHDKDKMYGLPKTIVIKYGETALRVIHRVWDLNLVYSSRVEIPGNDAGDFGPGTWLAAYAEDYKIANHDQVKKGVYITDVLSREHQDRVERAKKQREIFSWIMEDLSQAPQDILPSYRNTAIKTLGHCADTVDAFYDIFDEKGDADDEDKPIRKIIPTSEFDIRSNQAYQLWHIAARAAMTWEPCRVTTFQGIVRMYCKDIVRRRKREKRLQDAKLRNQSDGALGMDSESESDDEGYDESDKELDDFELDKSDESRNEDEDDSDGNYSIT
ncbi:hypothetical protein F53441_4444 [Fusarium austroafricanum]|uniref:Uncharacterized protein n=1 Tax=Fusarium austroafricanum TaxID=2364996 RepID=A0A8H4P0N7_9HYPO|nr:hypothetical protein F53441_4444 [Fusarium austroafricanum]